MKTNLLSFHQDRSRLYCRHITRFNGYYLLPVCYPNGKYQVRRKCVNWRTCDALDHNKVPMKAGAGQYLAGAFYVVACMRGRWEAKRTSGLRRFIRPLPACHQP